MSSEAISAARFNAYNAVQASLRRNIGHETRVDSHKQEVIYPDKVNNTTRKVTFDEYA